MTEKDFANIIFLIKQSRDNAIKAVNVELVNLYWNVGGYINKQLSSANWGEKTVDELANYIQKSHPELKGFNRRGLYRMKQFFEIYSADSIVSPVMAQLQMTENQINEIVPSAMTQFEISDIRTTILAQVSWTHHLTLIGRTKTSTEREFYLKLIIKEKYSVKELDRQINSGLFERTMLGSKQTSPQLNHLHPEITNAFKDTYVLNS